ncbi:MAG: DNA replication and repair protein RecF [Anaerolineaceae bacterium]|nr:DNA replication and repair protein RecF [Anaerolineaceae bacterium]
MQLKHLSLTNYRAFTRLDMDLPRRILLLIGGNAQGKTSVLEAVYFLATFTSFQAQHDRQIINFGLADEDLAVSRIVADFQRGERDHRIEVRLIREKTSNGSSRLRKEILIDGVKKSIQDALGNFNAVIFLPQMTRIVEGRPEDRRYYLNAMISQAVPRYASVLLEYNQIISQRNALLKQLAERRGDPDQLLQWDEMLSERGTFLIRARIAAIQEIERLATRIHNRLTHSKEVLRLSYIPSFDPRNQPKDQFSLPLQTSISRIDLSKDEIQRRFVERLLYLRNEEISRGVTTIGPHRDDLRFMGNGVDFGLYGSRGQVRSVLLSLKLAEIGWLKEKTGHWPVLLLDEIMAELDLQRREDLLSYLQNCEQALLTTTDLGLFLPGFVDQCMIWEVKGGMVQLTSK